ncbi:hypothetical protein PF001_g11256 [Phytophthora fragariae]|uniref:Rab-GAP TBC domain-containing protein n=1 Tax=Phytophthora fragariae TaxID=53985 RepID=A0A6A3L008_9STRA|nr:hypothetical protein PF003_g4655 [Phytophthora fragariae]KAE8939467.1 hypothetical protein PF009_g10682 [Phytophthora fragariae]KAE9012976.1 hypothetical protein PF011_g8672 [Phytophthora fragariae]KAE9145987.1 hypothetical protein PF006_g9199 [Phytophthora fragariae]KAE9308226.1 hypothetical protein PF001_g11256 [Phytophthora fragariae]
MLQGLRRKIGRYAPRGGAAKEAPAEEEPELRENASPIEAAVWHFNRQDRALRRLETEMTHMIEQIQVACATMATVAEIFSETCSHEDNCVGGEFKATMKQIEQEEAERMEQSIRFTVLDPLQATLERHDQLREDISAWEKLAAESKMLRAVTLKMQSSRLEDDDKRAQTEMDLHRVAEELQYSEKKLLPQLEDAVQSAAARTVDLFSTTRLQTSIFFRNTSESVLSGLTQAERELVAEANQPLKIPMAVKLTPPSVSLVKMPSSTSDGWTEVDGSSSSTAPDGVEAISGSDEDEECDESHLTLEDFEAGGVPQVQIVAKDETKAPRIDTQCDTAKLVALASYPVVAHNTEEGGESNGDQSSKIRRSTSPSPRTAHFQPITPRKTASMFWSIRKTIRGKLNYSSGQPRIIRQSSAPPIDTSGSANQSAANSPRKSGDHLYITPQSPTEWLAIEECLWEIDAREAKSPGKSMLTADSISSDTVDLLTGLLQKHDSLYFECLSYLRVEDLARLSKVNFRLHSHLVDSAPIWKKCIRSGGLSESIRSSLWLSVFYESTPWRSSGIASHYLSADRRCSMYDQLLSKVGTTLADGLDAEGISTLSDDDAQLAVWFREIDVDVVRTCHRSIYIKNVDAMSSSPSTIPVSACDDADQDTVRSVLDELVDLVVRGEDGESLSTDAHHTGAALSLDTQNPDLEAKIRRVLRAYVVYNPRVGYCQGMGFLVRLLAEVAEDEADIFWLFVGFSEPENDRNLYEPDMAVLQPYLSKFELLFSTHMPELYAHFQAEGVHVATFCTRWFLTFFSSFETLAPTLVIRLLDMFIIDGWRVMFSVSLVILDELQEQLMKCDMEGILRVLQFPRSYMPDPDQLRQRQLVRHALAFSISRAINSI